MKKTLLATVAAAALIAGPAMAQRQEAPASKSEAPARAPGSMQSAPAEKIAPPPGKAQPDRGAETRTPERSTTGQSSPSEMKAGSESKPGMSTEPKAGADTKSRAGTTDTKQAPSTAQGQTTQAGGSVALTTEQKTKIRSSVLTANAPRATNVNFAVNVGTVVPRTVRLVTVPAPLVEVHPAWRGFLYFVHGDQIVIVEPGTLRIVTIIEV